MLKPRSAARPPVKTGRQATKAGIGSSCTRFGGAVGAAATFSPGACAAEAAIDPGTLSEIVLFPALFALIGFLASVIVREMLRRSRLRMILEFRLRLLEQVKSGPDSATPLENEHGEQFLRDLAGDYAEESLPRRIAGAIQNGVVLLAGAAGFAVVAALDSFGARSGFTALAVMTGFAGAGFLLSGIIAWRLGAQWGLVPGLEAQPARKADAQPFGQ